MNIGILFSDLGPYHVARIEALDSQLKTLNYTLVAFQFSVNSDTYSWDASTPKSVKLITLYHKQPKSVLDSCKIAFCFFKELRRNHISTVLLPSFSPLPNFLCLLVVVIMRLRAIMMTESWLGTEKAGFFLKKFKYLIFKLFDSALVGGTPQKEYLLFYGFDKNKIFFGYDAVDVSYFSNESIKWKNFNGNFLGLPKKYFLNLGRFVEKKNLEILIDAYFIFLTKKPNTNISLVLVGEGSMKEVLLRKSRENSMCVNVYEIDDVMNCEVGGERAIYFYPFQQISLTPLFFSFCEAFILPSLYEEWGLVINEAMACGVPIIVSKNVGSARDLVVEGKNGFKFDPTNSEELANILSEFETNSNFNSKMGAESAFFIKDWGPEKFAQGALNAIKAACV